MAQLNDLNDDCLMQVLDRLPSEELLKLQRLNKRMKRLAGVKMLVKIVGMSLWVSNKFFSKCTAHLGVVTRRQVMCLIPALISSNSKPEFIMNALNRVEGRTSAIGRANLLDVFSRCYSIKRFDFELPGDLLLEVVKLCPEIECLKFGRLIKQDVWGQVLDLIGHRLVHVVKEEDALFNMLDYIEVVWSLATVAEKCANIRQIDWKVGNLSRDLIAVIKRLPKSCRVNINCHYLDENAFEDVVNELDILCWPRTFNQPTERLSVLKLNLFKGVDIIGTDFAGLRKLDFSGRRDYRLFVNFIVASQFSQLEEFSFNVSVDWRSVDYEAMFDKMTTVKRLTLVCEWHLKLPQKAIRRLKKLKAIVFLINHVPLVEEQVKFLQQLKQYIEEINSLKKLVIEPNYDSCEKNTWRQAFRDGIEKLKQEQSRVAVEFKL